MPYTIKELGNIIGRKPAMIYNYFNEDEETKSFYYSHRVKGSNGGYLYDDEVLERLKIKLGVSNGEVVDDIIKEDEETPLPSRPIQSKTDEELESVKAELEDIKVKYADAKETILKLETELKEMRENNGNLLWLLTQEKLEKQKLLPPPRKTIGEKIKALFTRKDTHESV